MSTQAPPIDLYHVLQVEPGAHQNVIQAAYHALARMLHPDRAASAGSDHRMAELNHAYSVLRDPQQRRAYDRQRATATTSPSPMPASAAAHPASAPGGLGRRTAVPVSKPGQRVVDFGRYRGWSLEALARQDPEYLEWLKRHSSGMGYRREIDEVLAASRTGRAPLRTAASR